MPSFVDEEFFVTAANTFADSICFSLVLREELIRAAVKKNGHARDMKDANLLFPPNIIQKTLVREKVANVLGCKCPICGSVDGRDLLTDNILIDAVTTEEGDEQRRLFAVLVFMGAGFAARHLCSFHTRGWDVAAEENSIRSYLFEPLESAGISPDIFQSTRAAEVTDIFLTIFKKTWKLFATPMVRLGSHETSLSGENLPFIKEKPLNNDKSAFGLLFEFEIHPEFRGDNIPARAVRKELKYNNTAVEERRTLEFLASCGKPNFIQLLFWYRYDDKINYVFPRYPGSLQQVLEGKMEDQIRASLPYKYGSKLNHWLWQGMVEIVAALKFFHLPEQHILPGQLIAAHFDMKPANILVDEMGKLIITDFGQARIRVLNIVGGSLLTAQSGDANYQPPPPPPRPTSVIPSQGATVDPARDVGLRWSRAYDVWSTACIMTEVIEHITSRGSEGYMSFHTRRFNEDRSSAAFWKLKPGGIGYELKKSVEETLRGFRKFQDQYLDTITDLLETMFAINPLERPPMADCLVVISEDIPTDEWPLKDDDEISICGLGTNPQLRNMHTQFMRKSDHDLRRCKMYFLSSISARRIRVAVEFDKEIVDGAESSNIVCILSDSARCAEEEYRPLSLFDASYKPIAGKSYACAFGIVHPNLTFIFDDAQRGPQEYYHFLTAVTRQRSLLPQVHMPILKCTFRLSQIMGKKLTFYEGHVQIWRELTDDEYRDQFTYTPPARKMPEVNHFGLGGNPKLRQDSALTQISRTTTGPRRTSTSTGSSGSIVRAANDVKTHRLVVFLTGEPPRCLTINLTNKFNRPQIHRNSNGHMSPSHVTFSSVGGNFKIGNFTGDKNCPGIPLDPEILSEQETFHVDWVELEFKAGAILGFENLWNRLFPPNG